MKNLVVIYQLKIINNRIYPKTNRSKYSKMKKKLKNLYNLANRKFVIFVYNS
jgi:hypothetical protein